MKYSTVRDLLKKMNVNADKIVYEDCQVVLEYGEVCQLEDYLEELEDIADNLELDVKVTEIASKARVTLFSN